MSDPNGADDTTGKHQQGKLDDHGQRATPSGTEIVPVEVSEQPAGPKPSSGQPRSEGGADDQQSCWQLPEWLYGLSRCAKKITAEWIMAIFTVIIAWTSCTQSELTRKAIKLTNDSVAEMKQANADARARDTENSKTTAKSIELATTTSNATTKAADQNEAAVKLAGDTAKKQLRAYVLPNPSGVVLEPIAQSGGAFKIIVPIENSGLTPAFDLMFETYAYFDFVTTKGEQATSVLQLAQEPSKNNLGSTQSTDIEWTFVFPADLRSFIAGTGAITIRVEGKTSYKDIFQEPHTTTFSFHSDPAARLQKHKLIVGTKNNAD